jgi:hypothetical protein
MYGILVVGTCCCIICSGGNDGSRYCSRCVGTLPNSNKPRNNFGNKKVVNPPIVNFAKVKIANNTISSLASGKNQVVAAVVAFHIAHMDLGAGSLRAVGRSCSTLQPFCSMLPASFPGYSTHYMPPGSTYAKPIGLICDSANWYTLHKNVARCRISNISAFVQKLSISLPIMTLRQQSSHLCTDCRTLMQRSSASCGVSVMLLC